MTLPLSLPRKAMRRLFVPRPPNSHKGDFGRVLVVAGSAGMPGAAALCARATLKSGAGLCYAASPAQICPIISVIIPEAITIPLPMSKEGTVSAKAINIFLKKTGEIKPDILVCGPGLTANKETAKFLLAALAEVKLPSLLDADALNILSQNNWRRIIKKIPSCIITPHPGEMERLTKKPTGQTEKERIKSARYVSLETGATVVLKGHGTIVSDGKNTYTNMTGNPALAKAGTGDVLAGIIAGFWAQEKGKMPFESACAGVFVHGLCADYARKDMGEMSVLAGELPDYLPKAVKAARRRL